MMSYKFRIGVILAISFGMSIIESCQKDLDLPTALADAKGGGTTTSPSADKIELGKRLYQDEYLSMNENDPTKFINGNPVLIQSCQSCHSPKQGFAGMSNYNAVSPFFQDINNQPYTRRFILGRAEGATPGDFGGRIPPSAAYAAFAPVFQAKAVSGGTQFFGGIFWDGRASGSRLGSPTAEQALGPFLSSVEMNVHAPGFRGSSTDAGLVANKKALLVRIRERGSRYLSLWKSAWGVDFPVDETTTDAVLINKTYDNVGLSIAAYEASNEVVPFTSSYDQYVATKTGPLASDPDALAGLTLFGAGSKTRKGANCASCHSINNGFNTAATFTNFGYENLGLPPAEQNAALSPIGKDPGLWGTLSKIPAYATAGFQSDNEGKFKTPTLRNVAEGEKFDRTFNGVGRRYMHNGVFETLAEVVHFYNTRDISGQGWPVNSTTGLPDGTTVPWFSRGQTDYPNTQKTGGEVGRIGLTWQEEKQLVAFMRHLTDGVWSK